VIKVSNPWREAIEVNFWFALGDAGLVSNPWREAIEEFLQKTYTVRTAVSNPWREAIEVENISKCIQSSVSNPWREAIEVTSWNTVKGVSTFPILGGRLLKEQNQWLQEV